MKTQKNGCQCGKDLWRLLRRTKPCVDRFRRNRSQNNYFEGFWRIKSLTNANIKDAFSPLFWCSLTVHLCLHVSYSIFFCEKPEIKRIFLSKHTTTWLWVSLCKLNEALAYFDSVRRWIFGKFLALYIFERYAGCFSQILKKNFHYTNMLNQMDKFSTKITLFIRF